VEKISGTPVPCNKAVIGLNSFTHESGIHTQAILANPLTYEVIPTKLVGRESQFVFGKHAGRAAAEWFAKKHNINISNEKMVDVLKDIKEMRISKSKKESESFVEKYHKFLEERGLSEKELVKIMQRYRT